MIVSGLGCWSIGFVLLKLGLRPSFISNQNPLLFLELDVGALDFLWSIGLVQLGLPPCFILNEKSCLFLDLDVGAVDLSF